MNNYHCYFEYLKADGAELFTVICVPDKKGKFPTTIYRTPYVDSERDLSEEEIVESWLKDHKGWLDSGYVSVYQHCRGTGKSTGDCIPYVNERKDGLLLQSWIRKQPFYNGEIFVSGGSYTSTVHYATAPFAPDIKGAVLAIQDCNRYRCTYRNGIFKSGLRMNWQNDMYKKNSIPKDKKPFNLDWCRTLPFAGISEKMFGERNESFEELLLHPDKNDTFWQNGEFAGAYSSEFTKTVDIPVLFVTGLYDFYIGGVFEMWKELKPEIRAKSAVIIHPYAHRIAGKDIPIEFPDGALNEHFAGHIGQWFKYCRGLGEPPVETGKITYYKMFGGWATDDFSTPANSMIFTLGNETKTYLYNPFAPASFKGGLSNGFGNTDWQDKPNSRQDIISVYTDEFKVDTFIKGKMKGKLRVKSDCEDTCFYMRVSLCKKEGDLGLRDDITMISNFCDNYKPNDEIDIDFSFDEHAFIVKKGEKIRVDISSSCFPTFLIHTNIKGNQALIDKAKIARNTVDLGKSQLTVYFE